MAVIEYECSECRGRVVVRFGSRRVGEEPTWSASHVCQKCGYAAEEDAHSPPPEYREIELQQSGRWQIHFVDGVNKKAQVILRRRLELTYAELSGLRRGATPPSGTRGEMDVLAYHLAAAGVVVEVVRCD